MSGFKRIRHYGLLTPVIKSERMSQARLLLDMPQSQPQAIDDAQAFMRRVAALEIDTCPHCRVGRQRLVQLLAPHRGSTPDALRQAVCRGLP